LLCIAAYRRRRIVSHGAGACGFSSAGNFHRAKASSRLKHGQFHSLGPHSVDFVVSVHDLRELGRPWSGRATMVLKMVLGH
jgi:hypothetical protein